MSAEWTMFWFALARAVHFATCLLLLGLWVFDRLIAAPTLARPDDSASKVLGTRWQSLLCRGHVVARPACPLSGTAWLGFVALDMSDLPPRKALSSKVLDQVLRETQFGHVWKWHAFFLLLTGLASLASRPASVSAGSGAARRWAALLCAAMLVGGLGWAGHGRTGPAPLSRLVADVLHFIACAAWPVGLLPFASLLWRLRLLEGPSRRRLAAALTRRFSAMSFVAVLVLTLSGIVNSWALVGSIHAMFSTTYGKVLLAKIACFALMVGLGAINLLILKPAISAGSGHVALQTTDPGSAADRAVGRLRLSVAGELTLGVVAIAVVGVLGLLPPALE